MTTPTTLEAAIEAVEKVLEATNRSRRFGTVSWRASNTLAREARASLERETALRAEIDTLRTQLQSATDLIDNMRAADLALEE